MKKLMVAMLGAALFCGCQGDYYNSNRCVTRDTNHTFTRATLLKPGASEVIEVIGWMDYRDSDSIQLWVKDKSAKKGCRVIYTHLNNVILENPDPEHLPKFNKIF